MATSTKPTGKPQSDRRGAPAGQTAGRDEPAWRGALKPLASLKLTVALFVMAIFLVLVGTLAQVEKDIWQVVAEYFRTPLAWVELRLFFPPSFFPGLTVPSAIHLPGHYMLPLGFYFPGGWLIGGVMMVNLLAAHALRFRVQAGGIRLVMGCAAVGAGALLTWLVIAGGSNSEGVLETAGMTWESVRVPFQAGLALSSLWLGYRYARGPRGRSLERILALGGAIVLAGMLAWTLRWGDAVQPGASSLRILWQMSKGLLASLVLLVGCVLLFRKKAGIVLLHAGIGLMMTGEVLTGLTAEEGQIRLTEGEQADFVRDIRSLELTITDGSRPDRDDVTVVSEARLREGGRVRHEALPFDIQLAHYFENSEISSAQSATRNPATAGLGLTWAAIPVRPVSGTDGGRINMPSAYIELLKKDRDEAFGTYLVGLAITEAGQAETIEVDGKPYSIALRHRLTYKPYSLKLIDVQKQDYPGTDIPRHYSSLVRLVDESRGVDREIKIWMNNPLRFAGETFYQSGYFMDPETKAETSTLAVVTNSGWMIPYVSCMIVATGLLTHFLASLLRFVRRRSESRPPVPSGRGHEPPAAGPPPKVGRAALASSLIPLAVVLTCGGWLIGKAIPPDPKGAGFALYEFGKLPVVYEGRAKPLDTLASNSLHILSGRTTFVDADGRRQPAIRWFLDLISRPEVAADQRVFRIENTEVLSLLGLEPREGFRYAFSEFGDKLGTLREEVGSAAALEPGQMSVYQKKVLELGRKLALWDTLITAYVPPSERLRSPFWAAGSGQFSLRQPAPLSVPPQPGRREWQTFAQAAAHGLAPEPPQDPASARVTWHLATILDAYAGDDPQTFHREVDRLRQEFRAAPLPDVDPVRLDYEAFFNHFAPFYHASVLYLAAFLFAALAWLGWSGPLNRASFWVILVTFGIHTFALASRMYISGRPPVTNLYSSAVFIGWAAVLLGLGLEVVYRLGIGNVIAATSGFATLLIAHFLAGSGDTFAVLQAVLDTQFWLATHVVCITLGYSATYVAGLLGAIYILRGVLTPSLAPETGKELARMIYGTTCFAILFSFVGTVLGGLWADDSWGRFWGWDPKENGALLIVLWNAVVLHARWGGMVRERGLAALAVAGNIVVSWSWFGVNELGIGLHSYGFTEGVLQALGLFVVSQLAIIALSLLPERLWRSRRPTALRHA